MSWPRSCTWICFWSPPEAALVQIEAVDAADPLRLLAESAARAPAAATSRSFFGTSLT